MLSTQKRPRQKYRTLCAHPDRPPSDLLVPASLPPPVQPCVPTTSPLASSPPWLLGTEENPSRLQRLSSPSRSQQQRPGVSGAVCDGGPVGEAFSAGGAGKGVGGGGERPAPCAYKTLVEEMSLTGAQFLDLVVSARDETSTLMANEMKP